ncbi:putative leucine-rich repeat-containing protein DDB_G0290503 isoform X1 [Wyeomyia smithii]|uniref:putative leucine-rich repeat-containing protein DDB_G0290503 isoform X1 n=1 Tax=Wyeomyia smithii TaxID=174621 RepID=UPI002467ACEF|nr:putative leucine-rich repeat-containing protein DDB_G0290503 isoform X1 [Wyeomyia smithii]XP_055541448.1 putative leucine-rich repeat-containing protein DDB_G0290503 isoform X1 [Wyeomyia smithii]
MDLSIFVVIIVGTLLSLLGLHFFLLKPLSAKSYEEMVKEKRELREKILGAANEGAGGIKSSKESSNKKVKKVNKKPQQQPQKQKAKEVEQDTAAVESDSNSSESPMEEEINPLTYAKKKINTSVEYAETERFALNETQAKKKDNKPMQGKKNKQKSGILLNKTEPVLVKPDPAPEINHFDVTHPKDAIEIARQQKEQKEDDSKNKTQQAKEQRKNKNKEQPKSLPKTSAVEEIPVIPVAAPVVVAEVLKTDTKQNTTAAPSKEKNNKKKKNEIITKQLAAEVQDAANVQALVQILAKADLPRNDIQILIDYLLNKQQDTLTKDPSEWNDPSDQLQKIKKQLQDKDNQLQEEQKSVVGLQGKLKELRQELNNEKVLHSSLVKGYNEELHAKRVELQNLQQQLQILSDKLNAEKQSLSHQYQQLHAKFVQLSKEHATAQENMASFQQLNENQQMLQRELMTKGQLLNEKLQIEEELLKKNAEYEMLLRSKDDLIQQRVQDIGAYESELQQLRVVANQKDELVKTCQQQSYELEQLKGQMDELQAKQKQAAAAVAAAAVVKNQVEENNKVEIRNLQNALDSSKTELVVCRTEIVDYRSKLADHEKQLQELRSREEDLQQQIEEQRSKNNDLRMKNWKLIEALQVVQNNSTKTSTNTNSGIKVDQLALSKNSTNHVDEPPVDIDKVILEEQTRTKDLLIKLLPSEIVSSLPLDATNFQSWLESTVTCIREQQDNLRISNATNSNNTSSTEVHINCNNKSNTSRSSNNANNNNNSLLESHDSDVGGDVEGSSSSKNGSVEVDPADESQVLAVKNEQLQKTVDQYKIIIAETENMLKNLESKVIEQDIHWRSVVQAKEKEINLLKSAGAMQ